MRKPLHQRVFFHILKPYLLLSLSLVIFLTSLGVQQNPPQALAANSGLARACSWYTVHFGDTLGKLSRRHHVNLWVLARVNYIRNVNLIFVNQRLCIPTVRSGYTRWKASGIQHNGIVRWYAYDALDWSNHAQTAALIRSVAAQQGIPANLMLAIAWQESGWTQHVISRDGGIGVMQLMPYTAAWINRVAGTHLDPYRLRDNLILGAIYLRWLWGQFGGNWVSIISAYNEGGYAVAHWGIYNWRYVNNVLFLSRRF